MKIGVFMCGFRGLARSFIETTWFLSCTEEKAYYLGVVKAWLGSSWRIGQLGKQQNRCFMV